MTTYALTAADLDGRAFCLGKFSGINPAAWPTDGKFSDTYRIHQHPSNEEKALVSWGNQRTEYYWYTVIRFIRNQEWRLISELDCPECGRIKERDDDYICPSCRAAE